LGGYLNISFSFEERNGGTLTSYVKTTQETTQETDQKADQKTDQKTTQKSAQKTAQKSAQKTAQKILDLMTDNPYITIAELSDTLGKGTRTIQNNINKLRSDNLLTRVGSDKGGHWEVKIKL
jgi:ATP-dependent DNA helicase RecG